MNSLTTWERGTGGYGTRVNPLEVGTVGCRPGKFRAVFTRRVTLVPVLG